MSSKPRRPKKPKFKPGKFHHGIVDKLPRGNPSLCIEDPAGYTVEQVMGQYVWSIIKRAMSWAPKDMDLQEDLVAQGLLGVLEAFREFDPVKANGNPRNFNNLVVMKIHGRQWELISAEKYQPFTVPTHVYTAFTKLSRLRRYIGEYQDGEAADFTIRNLHSPEFDQAAPRSVQDKVNAIKASVMCRETGGGSSYEEKICWLLQREQAMKDKKADLTQETAVDPEESIMLRLDLERMLERQTDPRMRSVLVRKIQGETLEDIAPDFGVTRQRIQQMIAEAFAEQERRQNLELLKAKFDRRPR